MKLNDDEGNIGIITEERMKEADEKIIVFTQIKRLNKIVDKLEQRIATLEKVLQSHAKCIGEMRDNLEDMPDEVLVKTWEEKNE
jgi:predicted RNase H-like nuclease (RuvC/YqgF family)